MEGVGLGGQSIRCVSSRSLKDRSGCETSYFAICWLFILAWCNGAKGTRVLGIDLDKGRETVRSVRAAIANHICRINGCRMTL